MRALLILPRKGFDEDAFVTLRDRLKAAGVQLTIAGDGKKLLGSGHLQIPPDVQLADAGITPYDCLIVLGSRELWGDKDAMQLVAGAALERKPIATLGLASILPAQATLLVDEDVACDPDEEAVAELAKHHARFVPLAFVAGPRVLSATSDAVDQLADALIQRLGVQPGVSP